MPAPRDHYRQYGRNKAALDALPSHMLDWRVTMRFYAALHLLMAYARLRGGAEALSHEETFGVMRSVALPPRLQTAYRRMYALSREVRYRCPPPHELAAADSESDALLRQIEDGVLHGVMVRV